MSACLGLASLTANADARNTPDYPIGKLRFIGEQILGNDQFMHTVPGGFSGLDYNAATQEWIAISDDPSELQPARWYGLKLKYDENNFSSIAITRVTFFRQPEGSFYPAKDPALKANPHVPDFEAIRFDPQDGSLWYSSEAYPEQDRPLLVRHANAAGTFIGEISLPPLFQIDPTNKSGPRRNLGLEGLSFALDGGSLWVAMEGPLVQDGEVSGVGRGAIARFTQFDRTGKLLQQFAYPVDAIPVPPAKGLWADNGVSELLAVNATQFLTLERSGSQDEGGVYRFHIRLYLVDLSDATDIAREPALKEASYRPATKKLLQDFKYLAHLDNLEALSWGPRLPNGNATLVIASDNNFNVNQVNQFLAFEVLPESSAVAPAAEPATR